MIPKNRLWNQHLFPKPVTTKSVMVLSKFSAAERNELRMGK